MTLELPNDLAQPLALDPLGDQHRLEQAGIVRQGIGLHAHERSESQPLATCERFDAMCRALRSTRCCRYGNLAWLVNAPPVQSLEQSLQLRRAQPHECG